MEETTAKTTTEQTSTTTTGDPTTEAKATYVTTRSAADEKEPIVKGAVRPADLMERDSAGCPAWYPDWDELEKIKPKIVLDPTKFLIPILTYGPNNQLRGFR